MPTVGKYVPVPKRGKTLVNLVILSLVLLLIGWSSRMLALNGESHLGFQPNRELNSVTLSK